MTLADGTIHQTIHKQSAHGPYLWALIWFDSINGETNVSIFSFWEDADTMRAKFQANGHITRLELACDYTRKVVVQS